MSKSFKHQAKREDIRRGPVGDATKSAAKNPGVDRTRVLSGKTERSDRKSGSAGYFVPGLRAVLELLLADPVRARRIWFEEGRSFAQIEELAAANSIAIQFASREELENRVGVGLARGVVLEATPPKNWVVEEWIDAYAGEEHEARLVLALDEVGDPQNLGAILRSAEFFGAGCVFWSKDRSAPLSALALRAAAGATERVPMAITTNLVRGLEAFKKAGFWVVGTTVDAPTTLSAFIGKKPPHRVVLVMGSEEKGLRRLTMDHCDFLVTIPRVGHVGSLNVSSAAAVCLSALAPHCRSDGSE
jgi:23S rRNA (guanosine2251-2'-O)-methyltransferase